MRKLVSGIFALLLGCSPAWAAPLQADWYINNSSYGLNFHFTMFVDQTAAESVVRFTAANEGSLAGYYRGFGVKHLFDDELSGVGTNWFSVTHHSGGSVTNLTQFRGGLNVKSSQSDYCRDGEGTFDGKICSELTVAGADVLLAAGDAIVFEFVVSGADTYTDYWHLQTKVYKAPLTSSGLGQIALDASPSPVPEPGTLALFSAGIAAGVARFRARRSRIKL